MKPASKSTRVTALALSLFGVSIPLTQAATVLTMTFGNGGLDINETTGWNGTTAPGGLLATGLSVSSGMRIYGDFTAQNSPDSFQVDNWHTTNSPTTRVGMTVTCQPGYTLNLGSGVETFSTKIHQQPTNVAQMFNAVELYINNTLIGSQPYVPAGGSQTLVWNIPSSPTLNNLTSAVIDMRFPGVTNAGNNNHGPEWSTADGAFVTLSGIVSIPEPSQFSLALFTLCLLGRRRRI